MEQPKLLSLVSNIDATNTGEQRKRFAVVAQQSSETITQVVQTSQIQAALAQKFNELLLKFKI